MSLEFLDVLSITRWWRKFHDATILQHLGCHVMLIIMYGHRDHGTPRYILEEILDRSKARATKSAQSKERHRAIALTRHCCTDDSLLSVQGFLFLRDPFAQP